MQTTETLMQSMNSSKIKREEYSKVIWIKFLNFNRGQLEPIKRHFSTVPEFHAFMDEPDEECDGAVCFIFERHKPLNKAQIKRCKELNEIHAKKAMKEIANICKSLKMYFNANTLNLRNLT